jgi:hypothetical protein
MVGSHEALGWWDPDKGAKLFWNGTAWETEKPICLADVDEPIDFKFVRLAGGAPVWEDGRIRALEMPKRSEAEMLLSANFNGTCISEALPQKGKDEEKVEDPVSQHIEEASGPSRDVVHDAKGADVDGTGKPAQREEEDETKTLVASYSEDWPKTLEDKIKSFVITNGLEAWKCTPFDKNGLQMNRPPNDREQWPITFVFTHQDAKWKARYQEVAKTLSDFRLQLDVEMKEWQLEEERAWAEERQLQRELALAHQELAAARHRLENAALQHLEQQRAVVTAPRGRGSVLGQGLGPRSSLGEVSITQPAVETANAANSVATKAKAAGHSLSPSDSTGIVRVKARLRSTGRPQIFSSL